ncbi:wee1-like protein kinase 2 [Paramacrobiotus metropolitanus]|uniref:wee1-like protein kinase 2 n=1 Tax=Paramacrobiotus metropolitanus TaxID=2943436 RepID=UPI0024458BB6|nr:wee1-like protein kinase 2 [Paramacrobiotus metropolitanus]XP_055327492.1 wee1-like protein kinase 2 [Paramacrobiotus metropolitanus]XP_055327493.1 wee1-like protein kinase 2 [Paramacrobiotus metropolitanus]XP_055327495.1 wee1-like protein kinase 2 [Paramacrobiotus metropolitanus]XP_055327496.1 wee1-like protein kinase 2 [Paramacrobiotus metropolitanus]
MEMLEEPFASPPPPRSQRKVLRRSEESGEADLSDPDLDIMPNKRLSFDESDDDLVVTENPEPEERCSQDVPMADVSGLRHQLGSMDMERDEELTERSMIFFASPDPIMGSPPSPLATVSEHDESGLHDMSTSPDPKVVQFVASIPATPAHFPADKPSMPHRRTFGEAPKSPVKSVNHRSRFSLDAKDEMAEQTGLDSGCNVNPFKAVGCVGGDAAQESRGYLQTKRSAATMLATPDLLLNPDISPPESGYGSCKSRPKYMKTEKVRFSLGSPSSSASSVSNSLSRYDNDFSELEVVGNGHFGVVTKVRKRLDGVVYAIKRTDDKLKQRSFTDIVTEVFALAALESHPNVLRYFSSWVENGYLYIQSEYCDAGSLRTHINQNIALEKRFEEDEIKRIARQAGSGLVFLHEQKLVHLDVKPDNIFMSYRRMQQSSCSPNEPKPSDNDSGRYLYKIGDLGHVRSFRSGSLDNYNDGDKRYLAPEILHCMSEAIADPSKADVYSLGITLFETARVCRTEETGTDWKWLDVAQRNGMIPGIAHLNLSLNVLFQRMTDLNPCQRLSMHEVLNDAAVHAPVAKSMSELQKDLEVAHIENMVLTRELKASRGSGPVLGDCGQRRGIGAIKPKITLLGRTIKNRAFSTQF